MGSLPVKPSYGFQARIEPQVQNPSYAPLRPHSPSKANSQGRGSLAFIPQALHLALKTTGSAPDADQKARVTRPPNRNTEESAIIGSTSQEPMARPQIMSTVVTKMGPITQKFRAIYRGCIYPLREFFDDGFNEHIFDQQRGRRQ